MVYGSGLENRRTFGCREFESHTFRQFAARTDVLRMAADELKASALFMQGGAARSARVAHNHEVARSNRAPATNHCRATRPR